MNRATSVDQYIEKATQYQPELIKLRAILNATELTETIKWGAPCYTIDDKNVVGMGSYKSYCGLWFFNGSEMSDPDSVLLNAQEGKTKAMRQWRFSNAKEIKARSIKAYIKDAIEVQRAGKAIKPARTKSLSIPPELKAALNKSKRAADAFDKLTLGKQREYAAYITDAKRTETKANRITKILPMIRDGVGLHDKYKNC